MISAQQLVEAWTCSAVTKSLMLTVRTAMLSAEHFSQPTLFATAANNSTIWFVFLRIKKS